MRKNFLVRLFLSAMLFAPIGANAQVTIGSNATPQATLDIIGNPSETGRAFRLIDGNEAPGKVLTVGDNGIATWQHLNSREIHGVRPSSEISVPFAPFNGFRQTGASITLPPGKWSVQLSGFFMPISTNPAFAVTITANNIAWVRLGFTENPAEGLSWTERSYDVNTTYARMVRGPLLLVTNSWNVTYENFIASKIIYNRSSNDKTYYLMAGDVATNDNFPETDINIRIRGLSIIATPISPIP